ncbi:UNVERIFIED_CONTAM: hypothetical protein NY100_28810, partial [Prevotella sp. 15_C9]
VGLILLLNRELDKLKPFPLGRCDFDNLDPIICKEDMSIDMSSFLYILFLPALAKIIIFARFISNSIL